MPTDVAQSRGPEKGIRDRVGDGISVGVPQKTGVIRNPDTAENERTCLVEAMRVVSEADPQSPLQARMAKHALCPPNPKELESATVTGRSTTPFWP